MNEIRKGGSIIGNRTRPFAYIFRANEKEKNLIDKAIATSGLTMTEFVIRSITDKPITVIENGSEILAELKRQGNNLNQAVRNSYNGLVTEEEIRSCIAELKKLYRKISAAIGGG
ncbi:MAG: plasmid mobilization protein [Christensenellales bacterium]